MSCWNFSQVEYIARHANMHKRTQATNKRIWDKVPEISRLDKDTLSLKWQTPNLQQYIGLSCIQMLIWITVANNGTICSWHVVPISTGGGGCRLPKSFGISLLSSYQGSHIPCNHTWMCYNELKYALLWFNVKITAATDGAKINCYFYILQFFYIQSKCLVHLQRYMIVK